MIFCSTLACTQQTIKKILLQNEMLYFLRDTLLYFNTIFYLYALDRNLIKIMVMSVVTILFIQSPMTYNMLTFGTIMSIIKPII